MEHKLPFLSLRLPKKIWNTKYQLNAKNNKNKLIGAYDIQQTLRHFLNLNANHAKELDNKQFSINDKNILHLRGISLFENIPRSRSCGDALIPDKYCSCVQTSKISKEDFEEKTNTKAEKVINFILDYVNKITERIRDKCVAYKFDKLDYINIINLKELHRFKFVLYFQPGEAIFDALVKFENNKFSILDKVVRLSRYGNQSDCVEDSYLKNYCFCKIK